MIRFHRSRERFKLKAMKDRGLRQSSYAVVEGDGTCKSGYQAMQWLLKQHPNMTAVFVTSDRMAIGAMRTVHDAGRTVLDGISVIGLDDIEDAAFHTPALTTVRQSFAEMGTLDVQLLLNLINTAVRVARRTNPARRAPVSIYRAVPITATCEKQYPD